MDEDEYWHNVIGEVALQGRNLDKEELKWAKELKELNFWKASSWDSNGHLIRYNQPEDYKPSREQELWIEKKRYEIEDQERAEQRRIWNEKKESKSSGKPFWKLW